MTAETIAMGRLLIAGGAVILLGAAIVAVWRSQWAEGQVKKKAKKLGLTPPDFILCAERRPSQSLPFPCTRHLGHAGDHVAGSRHGQVLATWPNVDAMPPLRVVGEQRTAGEYS